MQLPSPTSPAEGRGGEPIWQPSVAPASSGSYVWKTQGLEKVVTGGHASQRGSLRFWCRLEGLGSGEEANFFYLAEQRPE